MRTSSNPSNPNVLSSTISLSIFSIVNLVLGLVGTIIVTHTFSAYDFGIYVLILVVVSFLVQISTLGLEMSLARFISGTEDGVRKERFLGTAIFARVITLILVGALSWFAAPVFRMMFGQSLNKEILVYALFLFLLTSLNGLLKSILQGSFLFARIGFTDLIANFTNLILLVIFVYEFDGTIVHLVLARILAYIPSIVFALISIPVRKRILFDADVFKELMKFGFPLQVNDILNFVFLRIDSIVVVAALGPVNMAIYEVARRIPDYLRNIFEPFRSVYYPFLTKRYVLGDHAKADRLLNDSTRFVAFVTFFGTAIAMLFGKDIIRLLFSEKYLSSSPVFTILMINLSISLISNVMGTSLVAVGDTQKPAVINFFHALASWLCSLLLIPWLGLAGASIASMIGTIVAFPLNRHFLRKRLDLKDVPYLKPIALFCGWGLLVFLIKPEMLFVKAALLIVFILACVFLSIITKRDLALFLKDSGMITWPPLDKLGLWISKL